MHNVNARCKIQAHESHVREEITEETGEYVGVLMHMLHAEDICSDTNVATDSVQLRDLRDAGSCIAQLLYNSYTGRNKQSRAHTKMHRGMCITQFRPDTATSCALDTPQMHQTQSSRVF